MILNSSWLHSRFAEAFGWTLVHSLWELGIIAVVVGIAMPLVKRTANARYAVYCGALLLMLLAPIASYCVLLRGAAAPSGAGADAVDVPGGVSDASIVATVAAAGTIAPSWAHPAIAAIRGSLPLAVLLYGVGAGFFGLRLAGGFWRLRYISTRGTPVTGTAQEALAAVVGRFATSRPVRLLQSALVEVPTVLGILRPVILVPASALTGLSRDQITAILAHELAHIRRHDFLANTLQSVIEALLFYHPAVWWVSAKIRQQREHCCDDAAVAACGNPLTYARALATMEELRGAPRGVPAGLAVAARSGALLPRIRRILGVQPTPRRGGLISGSIALVMTLVMAGSLYMMGCTKPSAPASRGMVGEIQIPPPVPGQGPQILIKMSIVQVDETALATALSGTATAPADAKASATVLPVDAAQLLNIVTESKNAVVVSRPSILLSDRSTGQIMVGDRLSYVSGYMLKDPADPKSEPVPRVGSFDTGLKIGVVPTLHDDGKSVNVAIDAQITKLLDTKLLDAPPTAPGQNLKIQSPVLDTRTMKTTLTMATDESAVILGPLTAAHDAGKLPQRLVMFIKVRWPAGNLRAAATRSATQPAP